MVEGVVYGGLPFPGNMAAAFRMLSTLIQNIILNEIINVWYNTSTFIHFPLVFLSTDIFFFWTRCWTSCHGPPL